jgi:hypothetical protein
VVQRWLGAGAPVLHYVVPIGIGVVVTALGCWVGRGRRHAHVPENL